MCCVAPVGVVARSIARDRDMDTDPSLDDVSGLDGLFRREALERRRLTLEGEVVVFGNAWLKRGTLGIFLAVAIAFVILATSNVPRIEQAPGWITTTKGLVEVQPFRPGVVDEVRVHEGQAVRAGQILATIKIEQLQTDIGGTPETALLKSIHEQDDRLLDEISAARQQALAEDARLRDAIATATVQIDALKAEDTRAREIADYARKNVNVAITLQNQGAYSRRELWADQTDRSQKQLNIEAVRERLADLGGQRAADQVALLRIPIDRDEKIAGLEADRAALRQRLAETQEQRSYALTAPVSGRVASITARAGYSADGHRALISLIPAGARLSAELFVPSSAIGFVKPGQEVRLLYDSFPYQRFGSHTGHVTGVGQSAVLPSDLVAPVEIKEAVYIVTVALDREVVTAYGVQVPLQPGMTLSADIVVERRSIFEWLFEPLFVMRAAAE